jgi:glycosyltransferase involved in cell wall biosynthesis
MRIAYLSIGRHVHTERWVRYFVERGHECHLLTVQPGPIPGVQVHDIQQPAPVKALRYLRSLAVLRERLAAIRPDLLHTHFLTGYGYWGDFSGFRPNVLTVWGDDVYVTPHENLLKGWLARRALRHADAITGDSVDILRHCVELGAAAERCFEVQWGVDFRDFHPERASNVRAELGIPAGAPVLFSARSFTQPYYNLDIIIGAAAKLLRERPQAHIVFSGYEGDPTPFASMARAAGLNERAHFVGRIPHERFAEYLVASDVFLSVPSVDATAVSLLEAMACGRAIVVSALASSMEWIADAENGLVVAPRNENALLVAMRQLVDDAALRRRFGIACVEAVRSRADHAVNMDRVERLYRALVEGRELPPDLHSLAQRAAC